MIKLITYGDDKFYYSRKLIYLEALKVKSINAIKVYKKEDLPSQFLSNELMKYKRGGGYWLWKPYLIYEELIKMNNNDILIYVDAGCALLNTNEWNKFYNILENKSILLFKFSDMKDYQWNINNFKYSDYQKIKYWTKKKTLNYFDSKYHKCHENKEWVGDKSLLMAGLIICKKNDDSINFFKNMYDEMSLNPEVVLDPEGDELKDQFNFFVEHRHDQSILSIMAYNFIEKYNVEIIDENIEPICCEGEPAVLAIRRVISKGSYLTFFRKLLKGY